MTSDRESSSALDNPFATSQRLLQERLRLLLEALSPELRTDVVHALEGRGKLLYALEDESAHPALPAGVWPLLTLLVAQALSPGIDLHAASSVAVAIECFICALDLLDDVEDDDQTPTLQDLGVGRALNVSTTLLLLSLRALLSLPKGNEARPSLVSLLSALLEAALVAASGQHRDLLAEHWEVSDLTLEDCLAIASAKAGALMSLACRFGALCAEAEPSVCEQYADLGLLLGTAHQLDNDCHDLAAELGTAPLTTPDSRSPQAVKTDLRSKKKTLPIVLAAQQNAALQRGASSADEESQTVRTALQDGILATWSICLLYRERAHIRKQEIETRRAMTPALRLLLGLD